MKLHELLTEVVDTTHKKNARDVKNVNDAGLLIAKLGAIKSGEQAKDWGMKAKGVATATVKKALAATNTAWEAFQSQSNGTDEREAARLKWKEAGSSLCKALEAVMLKSIEKSDTKIKRTPINDIVTATDFANGWVNR